MIVRFPPRESCLIGKLFCFIGDNLGGDKLLLQDVGGVENRSLHNSILRSKYFVTIFLETGHIYLRVSTYQLGGQLIRIEKIFIFLKIFREKACDQFFTRPVMAVKDKNNERNYHLQCGQKKQ